jgi:hypothetical protein
MVVALALPLFSMCLGYGIFLIGSKRYVKQPPEKEKLWNTLKIIGGNFVCKPMDDSKQCNGGLYDDSFVDEVKRLLCVLPIMALYYPYIIFRSACIGMLRFQALAMKPVGFVDPGIMGNSKSFFGLIIGFAMGRFAYPELQKRGHIIPVTYKFTFVRTTQTNTQILVIPFLLTILRSLSFLYCRVPYVVFCL